MANGKVHLVITPPKRMDHTEEDCDPFRYEVQVLENGKPIIEHTYLYDENGSVLLPSGKNENLTVQVRAVSMFEDVAPSEWTDEMTVETKVVLPAPDVRAELIKTQGQYRYEFTLKNKEDYAAYDNWKVSVSFTDGTSIDLLQADGYTNTIQGKQAIQQMTVQAVPEKADPNLIASEKNAIPSYMPAYNPMIAIASGTGNRRTTKVSTQVNGTSLEELSVEVTLSDKNGALVDVPTIYRVELVGTWNGRSNVVFAGQDVLMAAQGEAKVVFTNLPEYLSKASDIKARVWYAQSGLGPVYTWHTLPSDTGANISILTDVQEDGTEVWEYAYSTVLQNTGSTIVGNLGQGATVSDFNNYADLTGTLFTWLKAPEILNANQDTLLTPKYDNDQRLYYTFYWDVGGSGTFVTTNDYKVKVYGIDDTGNRVLIQTEDGDIQKGVTDSVIGNNNKAYAINVDAEAWKYREVEIQVTRIGNNAGKQIGLTSTGTFRVRQRLPKPQRPSVEIPNKDELNYEICWDPVMPETGCSAYQIYVLPYKDSVTPENTPIPLGDPVRAGEVTADGRYQVMQSLEEYAGRRVEIYVVAAAEQGSQIYVDKEQGSQCSGGYSETNCNTECYI